MKVGFISDIHVDLNRKKGKDIITELLAEEVVKQNLDCLIIAGDISSDYQLSLATVDTLTTYTERKILFVPGNHDIWNEHHPESTAWDTYNALLAHPGNLARGPVFLNKEWAVMGDLGWYDYAFGEPNFSLEEFEKMKFRNKLWQDKVKSIWDRDTREMHKFFLEKLKDSLDKVKDKKIIAVTHVIPIQEFKVNISRTMWRYFNAFLGSPEYGELFIDRKVRIAVSGHVHYRKKVQHKDTLFLCVCLGYSIEWFPPRDAAKEIADTLQVIEI